MSQKFAFVIILLLIFFQPVFSQMESLQEINRLPIQTHVKSATVYPLSITEDWRPHMRNTRRVHTPGVNLYKDQKHKLKEEANGAAALSRSSGTNGLVIPKGSGITAPNILGGFAANGYSGSVPNDNDIAVSRGGMILSVTNELIHAYDTVGTLLYNLSLASFGGAAISSTKVFDPRVIYDADHDRFVVVYLNGATSATSHLIIAFSTTADPTGAWNVYAVSGDLNPSNINVWADFPQIGISQEELFITCNLFSDNGDSPGSGIWQIQLAEGYLGNPLVSQTHTLSNAFHLTPVKGASYNYGPNFYFIRKAAFNNDNTFAVYEIDNTIANGGQMLTASNLFSNLRYFMPPDVNQKGTTQMLETDEGRIQAAYKKGNRIYFVMSNGSNNRPGIYYGTVMLSPLGLGFSTIRGEYITDDTLELGYPSIAFGGRTNAAGDCDNVIMFNFASPYHHAGNGVVYIDTSGNVSDPTICAEGLAAHGFGNPNEAYRWGDYSGIATRKPGEVWVSGYYVRADGRNTTWISQVSPSGAVIASPIEEKFSQNLNPIKAYPSPAVEMVFFEFEVPRSDIYRAEILDMNGRIVHLIMEEKLKPGDAKVGFNTLPISNGFYIIRVKSEKGELLQKRFVVGH